MDKFNSILETISPLDRTNQAGIQHKLDYLTKPQGSLGRLEELARRLVGITGNPHPGVDKKTVIVMAGDHGVVAEGVSAYPQEVTP